MCRYHTDVTSHDFHAAQTTAQNTVRLQHKAFRTNTDPYLTVCLSCCLQHSLFTDIELPVTNLTFKHVNRRSSEELRNKEIHRMVVYLLRLSDLLQHAILHDNNQVRDAHRLLLIVCYENSGNLRLSLDSANLFSGLQTKTRIEV